MHGHVILLMFVAYCIIFYYNYNTSCVLYMQDDLAYTVHVLQKLQQELNVFGVLGPSDPAVLEIMSHVAGNVYKKLIVSFHAFDMTCCRQLYNPKSFGSKGFVSRV